MTTVILLVPAQVAIFTVGIMNGNGTLPQMNPSVDSMKLSSWNVTSGDVLLEMDSVAQAQPQCHAFV